MEEALVRRREHEREKQEYWNAATKYFDQVERACGKFQNWSSPEMAQHR